MNQRTQRQFEQSRLTFKRTCLSRRESANISLEAVAGHFLKNIRKTKQKRQQHQHSASMLENPHVNETVLCGGAMFLLFSPATNHRPWGQCASSSSGLLAVDSDVIATCRRTCSCILLQLWLLWLLLYNKYDSRSVIGQVTDEEWLQSLLPVSCLEVRPKRNTC